MDFINEEQFDEPHQLLVIFPLSSDAIPLLGSGDDDVGTLNVPKICGVGITSKLNTVEPNLAELRLPMPLTLRAKSFRRCLVDDLVLARSICSNCSADSQLQDRGLATTCGRCKDEIVVRLVHADKTFRLDSIEIRVWKDCAQAIRQLADGYEGNPLANRNVLVRYDR